MVASMLPTQAFATETELQSLEEGIAPSVPVSEEPQTVYEQVQQKADDMLLKYLGSTALSPEETVAAVYALNNDAFYSATAEIDAFVKQMAQLTEEEILSFGEANPSFVVFADTIVAANSYDIMLLATSGTVLNGQVTVTDTASNVSVSGNTATVTIKGSGGLTSGSTSSNTITITNTSGSMAMISFDYACSATGTYTFSESSHSGSISKMLAAGESITMTMSATGGALFSSSTATLKLTNFSIVIPKESSSVTVVYEEAKGSVTADGTAISTDTTLENITPADGVNLVATPANGYNFVCWVDSSDDSTIYYDSTYLLKPDDDISLKAVFAKSDSEAFFSIEKKLYNSLNSALAAAGSGSVISLVGNGTLAAGDYTIPSGITLLIPMDESNITYTTAPATSDATTTPSAYRTLTLANGANLTINGTMSVPGKHYRSGGRTVGPHGRVHLNEGSSIKVNSTLYAYGYITGKGSVKIMSGASVYEYFQIIDFRGGTATSSMRGNSKKVFPLSQYYVQNVEAPMTLEAGATEYGYTTLYMSSLEFNSTVKFIGTSGAMFNLTSGSVTKEYDCATDRLIIKANGTMKLDPISLSISSFTLKSSDYVLPLNSNFTIELQSGTATINQDLALLPEAKLLINSGATCKLASGVNLYVYDADQWDNYVYNNARLRVVPYAAGRTYKSATSSSRTVANDAQIQVAGTLDASSGKLYTTESGAAITGSEGGKIKMSSVSSGSTYQVTQSGTDVSYVSIPVTSAKLLNADGTYSATSANTYSYEDGLWTVSCDHNYTSTRQEPTCSDPGSITYTCSKCGRSYSETLSATGHTAGQAVKENIVAATCTAGGSYDSVTKCATCGTEMSREPIATDPAGHSYNEGVITTPADCTNTGIKTFTCGSCGDSYTKIVDALGHKMVYTSVQEPTCEDPGQSASAYCERCDYVEESGGTIPALGHDWQVTSTQAPTCDEPGSITSQCSRCLETSTETTQATGHSYESSVTAPTCSDQGYTTHTCSACGHSYKDTLVSAKGHTYTEEVTPPTCEEDGYTTYTCSVCGDHYEDDTVDATGHDYGDGTVTQIATCTEPGNRNYTCAVCGNSYDEQIPALEHNLTYSPKKLASYTSVGWDAYEECNRCEHSTYREYPILTRQSVGDYETFLEDLRILEQIADAYVDENPGKDPASLVLNYIRNGIESYTTTSWAIMAGSENTHFTAYVTAYEDAYNTLVTQEADLISVVSIRDLEHFAAPSDPSYKLEFSHMFGTMDITGYNPGSVNHADVAGWSGDLVDLLDLVDNKTVVTGKTTVEEMVDAIFANDLIAGEVESFGRQDVYGDLDAYYIMRKLSQQAYYPGLLSDIIEDYFVESLTDADRASYFIKNRMNGITGRTQLREAVYAAYAGNKLNTTLEGTRTFVSDANKLYNLRMACCYAFADYLWKLAGDYVEDSEQPAFTVTSSETVTLAPGIIQQISTATANSNQLRYYVTIADLTGDVRIDSAAGNGTLLALAQNYDANVIAAINAGNINAGVYESSANFAAVLTGTQLVQDGKRVAAAGDSRISGTAAGVTKTGKAVFVTAENATAEEIAQILLDTGCNTAFLLDSGSKTSYISRAETVEGFTDHTENTETVQSVLMMVSTAPDDTVFDHAVLTADYSYLTPNAQVQILAAGATARGTEVEIPSGTLRWDVSNTAVGSVDANGLFTATAAGQTQVTLRLDGKQIGSILLQVVTPDTLYFTSSSINAYFGEATPLPLAAQYQRKPVAITPADVRFTVSDSDEGISGGSVSGFDFTANEASGLRTIRITAALASNGNVSDTISVTMYQQGDVAFDFNNATGGDRKLAWLRDVSNATTEDDNTYYVVDPQQPMVVDYTLAIDMSAIEVPEQLKDLTTMLPGADSTDGSAWGFLLKLADRISDLSEVKAVIQMDPNFDVDLTELKIQNEYIRLRSVDLDEDTNLLTVTLNWIKQDSAIDPTTANPICVVTGIKQIPKESVARSADSTFAPVNSGTLSYRFYLSAGALYTFAGDEVNQQTYGLQPYINPNNTSDRGASFGAEYATFQDTFTMIDELKNGWYFEEGKNVFYVDGVLHTEHHPKESVVAPPTCSEGGYTTHICSICGISYITDKTNAEGHDLGQWVTTDATCTEDGSKRKDCSRCDYYEEETLPKLGHDYSVDVKDELHLKDAASNCTEVDTYWYDCSRCGACAKDDPDAANKFWVSKDAGAHSFTEQLTDEKHLVEGTGANCQSAKKYYFDCKHCDEIGSITWTSTTFGDHDFSEQVSDEKHLVEGTGVNCQSAKKYYFDCKHCDKIGSASWISGVYGNHVYDTENWGYQTAAGHAHLCKIEGCTTHDSIQDHSPNIPEATEETAQVCADCGFEIAPKKDHVHKWADSYTSENGSHFKTCSGCNERAEEGSCSGGNANCQEQAICTVCQEPYGELGGHALQYVQAQTATCTDIGWDAYEYCSKCDHTTYKEIAATGHTYVDGKCECGAADPTVGLLGDADGNGYINNRDAMLIAQYVVNPENVKINYTLADVDSNGFVNNRDAMFIAQYVIGIITTFPN